MSLLRRLHAEVRRRLWIHELPDIDQQILIENLRNHWQLDIWSVPGQLIALIAMSRVIAHTSLSPLQWGGPVALLLLTWAWGSLSLRRLRNVTITPNNYPLWRAITIARELSQSIGWGWLGALLWGALAPQWHLLLLTGLIVFAYTAMFFTTDDWVVAASGNVPILIILVARLLADPAEGNGFIVLILLLSMITCLIVGRVLENRLMDAARLRIRNEMLANELTDEVRKARQARDEAQQANRQKLEFIAAASHDLRQPLHSLSLLSGLMEQSQRDSPQHSLAERMSAAVGSLRVIFEQLFDIARLEANKLQHRPGPCAVHTLFAELDSEFSLLCQQKQLAWRVQPSDDWIDVDALFVQRILRNLLDNALRYTAHGGLLLRARRRGPDVLLQVWDSGVGIAQADQARIFDDYVQIHNPARRLREGLGLGLGLVRRLAQVASYGLGVRSRPGKGSCFTLRVPRCTAAQIPAPAQSITPAAAPGTARSLHSTHSRAPVLLIDDEDDVRHAADAVLHAQGFAVLAGSTPDEVIEQVAAQGIDAPWPCAVLCDYRLGLPIDGLQAVAQVRHEFGLSLPALLITGDVDPGIAERAHECGITLLRKPLSSEALIDALNRALQHGHPH